MPELPDYGVPLTIRHMLTHTSGLRDWGSIAGIAGGVYAYYFQYISPDQFEILQSAQILTMVVLGGMGTLFGPIVGAAAFVLLEEWLADLTEHWQIILGPVLLFVVVFARRGIWGWIAGPAREDR